MGAARRDPTFLAPFDALQQHGLWCLWKFEGERHAKVPYAVPGTRRASVTSPGDWATLAEALRHVDGFAGVGVLLGPISEHRHLGGIDLDACIRADGSLERHAQEIVELVPTYAEISPSGTGLKLYFTHDPTETLADGVLWLSVVRKDNPNGGKKIGIEQYLKNRFFCATGQQFGGIEVICHVGMPVLLKVQEIMKRLNPEQASAKAKAETRREQNRLRSSHPDFEPLKVLAVEAARAIDLANADNWCGRNLRVRCPCHADEHPSLDLADGADGLLAVCRSHCAPTDVYRKVRELLVARPSGNSDRPAGLPASGSDDAGSEELPAGVGYDEFAAYMVQGKFIYMPTGQLWPASSVNARLPWFGKISPAAWLAQNRPVEQMTWMPGVPQIILDRLIVEGGWTARLGARAFNLYKPPTLELGDAAEAGPWCDLVRKLWPDEAEHLFNYLAHRAQHPDDKVNHALVLGGPPGIGKDTVLAALRQAVGPWNVQSISPPAFVERFNAYCRAIVLVINEARDTKYDRYQFYEHMKIYAAAPPEVLRVNEKHIQEYYVPNLCAPIITTNHKTNGIYLPAEDRRHFVAWSDLTEAAFVAGYWPRLWRWYDAGGFGHVAAWLARRDLSAFNAKAPPPKTEAFWAIVNTNRATEDAELADVLDRLDNPVITTLDEVLRHTTGDFHGWLADRKNRRNIPHRFESCGYLPVRNPDAKDGLWKINGARQVVYGHRDHDRRTHITRVRMMNQGGTQ